MVGYGTIDVTEPGAEGDDSPLVPALLASAGLLVVVGLVMALFDSALTHWLGYGTAVLATLISIAIRYFRRKEALKANTAPKTYLQWTVPGIVVISMALVIWHALKLATRAS